MLGIEASCIEIYKNKNSCIQLHLNRFPKYSKTKVSKNNKNQKKKTKKKEERIGKERKEIQNNNDCDYGLLCQEEDTLRRLHYCFLGCLQYCT